MLALLLSCCFYVFDRFVADVPLDANCQVGVEPLDGIKGRMCVLLLQKGMTREEVEATLGHPSFSHRTFCGGNLLDPGTESMSYLSLSLSLHFDRQNRLESYRLPQQPTLEEEFEIYSVNLDCQLACNASPEEIKAAKKLLMDVCFRLLGVSDARLNARAARKLEELGH